MYGCMQSAILWYELISHALIGMGFVINSYDKFVANKMIDGKQCTIAWCINDVKVAHVDPNVNTKITEYIKKHFG